MYPTLSTSPGSPTPGQRRHFEGKISASDHQTAIHYTPDLLFSLVTPFVG